MPLSLRPFAIPLLTMGCFGPLKAPSDASSDRSTPDLFVAPTPDIVDGGELRDASEEAVATIDKAMVDVVDVPVVDGVFDVPIERASEDVTMHEDTTDVITDANVRVDAVADVRLDAVTTDARSDVSGDASMSPDPSIAPPRLLAPLASSRTSARPRFLWRLAAGTDGAVIDVCRDRACSMIEQSVAVASNRAVIAANLEAGYHWWRARGRRGATPGVTATPAWSFYVAMPRMGVTVPLPQAWGSMPDINGDGRTDVITSAPSAATGLGMRGGLGYLFAGVTGGFVTAPTLTYNTTSARVAYGTYASVVGDLNGDGFPEYAFGSPIGSSEYTEVFQGAPTPSAMVYREYVSWTHPGSAGDVNGDGYGDLLLFNGASVGVVHGAASGPANAPARTIGASGAVGLGDLDGDGYGEIAVLSAVDRIAVHGGSASGTQVGANYTLEGPRGWVLSNLTLAGDVNADGVIDLVATATAAAPGATPSRAAVIYLVRTATDRAQAPVILAPPPARVAAFGMACAGVGDVNGDGVDDVAVGTGTNDATAMNYVCVFPGTVMGIGTSPMQCISGPPLARMGASVGGAGDVNGDGLEDVLVGARGIVDMTRGTVQLFRGRITGLTDTAAVTLTGADIGGQFGSSLSGWR